MSLTSEDLEAMYRRYAQELLAYLARRVRDPDIALELVADTFLSAFDSRRRCRAQSEHERAAWLYGIAAHKFKEHMRRTARERSGLERLGGLRRLTESEYERVEQLASDGELHRRVEKALAQLNEDQQETIRSRVLQERSYSEVAEDLGITEQAARARVARGMATLRRALRPLRAGGR